jgi:hypothetical protein
VLEQLIKPLEGEAGMYLGLINELRTKLDKVKDFCGPIRDIRNRAIGHLDLKTTSCLTSVREFMNHFERYFCSPDITGYEHVSPGADSLISNLNARWIIGTQ